MHFHVLCPSSTGHFSKIKCYNFSSPKGTHSSCHVTHWGQWAISTSASQNVPPIESTLTTQEHLEQRRCWDPPCKGLCQQKYFLCPPPASCPVLKQMKALSKTLFEYEPPFCTLCCQPSKWDVSRGARAGSLWGKLQLLPSTMSFPSSGFPAL